MHAISYLLKLQINHVILDGHDQTCPKRSLNSCISKNYWSSKVDFWTPARWQKGILREHEEKEDTENLKIWNRYCKTCKYRTIYNDKNLFVYLNSEGQSCYAYLAEVHSIATCFFFLQKLCLMIGINECV